MDFSSKLDPRTKLALLVGTTTPAVFVHRPLFLFCIMCIILLLCLVLKVDLQRILRSLRFIIRMIIFVGLIQCIFIRTGKPLVSIDGFVLFTADGVSRAILMVMRVIAIIMGASIMTTSKQRDSIQGLVQMKFPYELAFMLMIALRFLPMFREEFRNAMLAIQLRGVDINGMKLKKRLRVYSYIFMPVVAGVMLKSQDLSMVMEMRAFRAFPKRSSIRTLILCKMDYAIMLFAVLFLAAAVYLNFFTGFLAINF